MLSSLKNFNPILIIKSIAWQRNSVKSPMHLIEPKTRPDGGHSIPTILQLLLPLLPLQLLKLHLMSGIDVVWGQWLK